MNKVIISGMLGKDPEMRELASGVMKAEMSVANKIWTKNGEKTIWVTVRVIGKRATAVQGRLRKGSKVWVEGIWDQDEWIDKATQTKRRMDYVFASSIEWDFRGASVADHDDEPNGNHRDDDEGGY